MNEEANGEMNDITRCRHRARFVIACEQAHLCSIWVSEIEWMFALRSASGVSDEGGEFSAHRAPMSRH